MVNRTICDMLAEIRKCHETHNYSYLLGLVEEIQTAANKMEAALWDQKEFTYMQERYRKLKKEVRKMEKEKD